jgi:hypothetical protein
MQYGNSLFLKKIRNKFFYWMSAIIGACLFSVLALLPELEWKAFAVVWVDAFFILCYQILHVNYVSLLVDSNTSILLPIKKMRRGRYRMSRPHSFQLAENRGKRREAVSIRRMSAQTNWKFQEKKIERINLQRQLKNTFEHEKLKRKTLKKGQAFFLIKTFILIVMVGLSAATMGQKMVFPLLNYVVQMFVLVYSMR